MKSMETRRFGRDSSESIKFGGDNNQVVKELRETNARLIALIQSIPDVIFFKDNDGRYQLANRAAELFMGVDLQGLIGRTDHELLPQDLAEQCRESDERVLREGRPRSFEEQYCWENGEASFFETIKSPILDEEGNQIGLVGVARDITQRKRNEEKLQASNDALQGQLRFIETLLETIPLAVFYKDVQGRYLGCNEAFSIIMGVSREEIIGKSVFDLWQEDLAQVYHDHDQELLRNPGRQIYEQTIRNLQGESFHVMYSKDVFLDEKGQVGGIIGAFLDISKRKKAENDLKILNETLELRIKEEVAACREKEQMLLQQSKMATMGEMIGAIAHQWRQPLNFVGLQVQDLMWTYQYRELNNIYLTKATEDIMDQIKFMSRTIDDFRNFFRPTKEKELFNIGHAIRDTLSLVSAQLARNFIQVKVVIANESLVVEGYPNEFKHAMLNLTMNARDALLEAAEACQDQSGTCGQISISATEQDEAIVITLADNAAGIPLQIIDRIFEPYFTTKESSKGSGIGLYMAKRIIEQNMGGSLTVRNLDQGAEFRVAFHAI